jgi:hypothetical protein
MILYSSIYGGNFNETSLLTITTIMFSSILKLAVVLSALPLSFAMPNPSLQLPTSAICLPIGRTPPSAVTLKQTGKNCNQYGDPPAAVLNGITSPDGLQDGLAICNGKIITITDNLGEIRKACLYVNPASTAAKPLPLIVWLHPSLASASNSFPSTMWDSVKTTQPLNNEDPTALGFSYILPFGRNTVHQCEYIFEIEWFNIDIATPTGRPST